MKRGQWILSLSLSALAAFSVGCDDNDSDNVVVENSGPNPTGTQPTLTTPTVVLKLAGNTFESVCLEKSLLDMTSTTRRLVFQPTGEFQKSESFFLGDDCGTDPYMIYETRGTYTDHGPSTDVSTSKIDYAVAASTITAMHEGLVVTLNTRSFCGKSDWTVGQAVDVTGKSCEGMPINAAKEVADIYLIEEDVLFFSNSFSYDAATSAVRPTSVDRDVGYRIPVIQ